MARKQIQLMGAVVVLNLIITFSLYAVPNRINFQGELTDSGGIPLNGNFTMTFRLFNTSTGGSSIWNETQSVNVADGIYSVHLGALNPLGVSLFKNDNLYLEVVISGETLTPRQRITSTAFSMKAGDAETLDGSGPSAFATNSHTHSGSDINTGIVAETRIANTIARDSEITWANLSGIPAGFDDNVDNEGIKSETDPTITDPAVKDGVSWNEVSAKPAGFDDNVDNNTTYSAGTGLDLVGTQFRIEVPLALSGSSLSNIISATNTGTGRGVYGLSTSNSGVRGETGDTASSGVYGMHNPTFNYGRLGTQKYGVHGYALDGWGVYGQGVNNHGVLGSSTNAVGVYGQSSNSYAGYFLGSVHVLGNLSKSTGSFKIDHPLYPENMYLNHSFVESSEMKNVYDGVVILDENGEAWIMLPEWFEALNRNYRYQLTSIGVPGPNLYIAKEISENRFKIAGGTAAMKVSWQVTGIRHDPYAIAHQLLVEEHKQENDIGKYLHPEIYGQPKENGIGWVNPD